jgi:hypothetical protein
LPEVRDNIRGVLSTPPLRLSLSVRPHLFNPNIKKKNFGLWLAGAAFRQVVFQWWHLASHQPERLKQSPAMPRKAQQSAA